MSTRLAEVLMQYNAVTREQLDEAMEASVCGRPDRGIQEGDFLGKVLVQLGHLKPKDIIRAIRAAQYKPSYVTLAGWTIDPVLASALPPELAQKHSVLPLLHLQRHLPMVLSKTPLSADARAELRDALKVDVDELPASDEPVDQLIAKLYGTLVQRAQRPEGLGEAFVKENLIPRERLEAAEQAARREGVTLAEYLVREQNVDGAKAFRVLAHSLKVPFLAPHELAMLNPDMGMIRKATPEYIRSTRSMPIIMDGTTLTVLTLDPGQDVSALNLIAPRIRTLKKVVTSYNAFAALFKEAFDIRLTEWAKGESAPPPQPFVNPKFRDAVIAAKYMTEAEYDRLRGANNGDDLALLDHLHREELVTKDCLGKLWGDSLGVAYLNLDRTLIQESTVRMLPEDFAREHKIVLVYEFGGTITAAMRKPDQVLAQRAEALVGRKVEAVVSLPAEIQAAIDLFYQSDSEIKELADKLAILDVSGDRSVSLEKLKTAAGSEAVINFAEGLLLLAVKEGASDIHVEPGEEGVRIRFRIDGHLQERFSLNKNVLPPLLSRLKILAAADIIERRLPQDGRISLTLGDHMIDFRFSTTPTVHGEKAVLRVLGQTQRQPIPDLKELMFSKSNMEKLLGLLARPNGIFFVTGPTGSGKSLTLYSCLKYLNNPDTNIMTIEDPVEYRLQGINQIQINTDIGLDCQRALRSFLRQDPDIILVGEIRDKETAKLAAEAALTGHLVLATLHTNSATQAFTRLIEIGVDPYVVSPAIIGAMAQRLVRRICPNCKQEHVLTSEEADALFTHTGGKRVSFYQGKGCERCRHTGFKGRLAIHEILEVNDEIRTLISRGGSMVEVHKAGVEAGFTSMHQDGMKKVLRGLTTLAEVNEMAIR
ncbi:MAG TPA: ATPase, T2SS/T4P/T4SS family [Planctomycetota bacterium]|jgi:type IV pilus assembly protein PilB